MSQVFSTVLEREVLKYCRSRGDGNVHLSKFVNNRDGIPLLLVRFNNKRNLRMSSLMFFCQAFDRDGVSEGFTITEEYSTPRTFEDRMIEWYMNGEDEKAVPSSLTICAD